MKSLNFNNQQFKAQKIIKTDTDIIGYDINANELFSFRGISDFSGFTLGEEQEFDISQSSVEDLQKQIFDLTTQLVAGGVL